MLNFLTIDCHATCNSQSTTTQSPQFIRRSSFPTSSNINQSPYSKSNPMNYPCSSTKSAETSSSTKINKTKTKSGKRERSTPPNTENARACRND